MKHPTIRLVLGVFSAAQIAPMAVSAQAGPPIYGVKGKLEAVTHDSISIQANSGIVRIEPGIKLSRVS
jgi:hypothetical protein